MSPTHPLRQRQQEIGWYEQGTEESEDFFQLESQKEQERWDGDEKGRGSREEEEEMVIRRKESHETAER